jgi:hypothetical protein
MSHLIQMAYVWACVRWLLAAVVAANTAAARGRSGFGFFALSKLFLGPLIIARALIVPKDERVVGLAQLAPLFEIERGL